MLTENFESAELMVSVYFQINALKKTLRTEHNLDVLDFLECYNHLNHMLNQAVYMENKEMRREKIDQVSRYIQKLIEFTATKTFDLKNGEEAKEILKNIRQRLHLIDCIAKNDQDHERVAR